MATKVTLEPELEEMAALWPALRRIDHGRVFLRWGKQLILSGKIMIRNSSPQKKRGARGLPRRKAALN